MVVVAVAVAYDGYSAFLICVRFSVSVLVAEPLSINTQHTPNPDAQLPDLVPFLSLHSVVV
jgi:hypothetical protein